jgi:energy-coupling factor transporter ATP-binding protein EcfA2
MRHAIRSTIKITDSYRAARVRAMFNTTGEQASSHEFSVDAPIDSRPWRIGLIVGPSGSGKTTLAREIMPGAYFDGFDWPHDAPIVDAIDPGGDLDDVCGALSAVGLGTVPAWLRPYRILSGGERFRADLGRIVAEPGRDVVVDEFTSVVDRQVARIGAAAFAKAWRRKPEGRVVLVACHDDVEEWLQPDWVIRSSDWTFHWRMVQRPPAIVGDIYQTDWRYWPAFEIHHYLKVPKMVAATNYVLAVDGGLVAHIAISTRPGMKEARACRLVVMPEWQGAGLGMKFMETVLQMWVDGENRFGIKMPSLFHTSHPGLIAALKGRRGWRFVSRQICGVNKARSRATMIRSGQGAAAGYGGHTRAVMGFRYVGR